MHIRWRSGSPTFQRTGPSKWCCSARVIPLSKTIEHVTSRTRRGTVWGPRPRPQSYLLINARKILMDGSTAEPFM